MCADLEHTPSEVEFEENWVAAFDRKEGKVTFHFPPWVLQRAVVESRRSWARPAWPGGQGCTQPGGPLSLSACQAHDLPEVSRRLFSSPQSLSLTQESLLSKSRLSRKKAQGSTQRVETLLLVIRGRGSSSGGGVLGREPPHPKCPWWGRRSRERKSQAGLRAGDRRPSETVSPPEPKSGASPVWDILPR